MVLVYIISYPESDPTDTHRQCIAIICYRFTRESLGKISTISARLIFILTLIVKVSTVWFLSMDIALFKHINSELQSLSHIS